MSCDLIGGKLEGCKSAVGGLLAVYFINFDDLDIEANATFGSTHESDVITAIAAGSTTLYKFELKADANSMETNIQASRENGTSFFNSVLNIAIKKQDTKTTKNIKLMSYGRPYCIVHTRGNQFFLMGLQQGCDVTGGTMSAGSSLDSFVGYTVTLEANEVTPPNFLNCSTETALTALMGGAITIETT